MTTAIVLSLGGSLILPKDGIALNYLRLFRDFILKLTADGVHICIVVGGGEITRSYQNAARELTPDIDPIVLDYLGIDQIAVNARLVHSLFVNHAHPEIIKNYNEFSKTDSQSPITIGAAHLPGHSSDYDAVFLAIRIGVNAIVNLTNIDYIYDKDPIKNPDAKPLTQATWEDILKQIHAWQPGLHFPVDPAAAKLAHTHRIEMRIVQGHNLENVRNAVLGKNFIGTHIR